MDQITVIWVGFALAMAMFVVVAAAFFGGLHMGIGIGSGGVRGIFGVKKGGSFQASDPDQPDPMKAFVGQQFTGWSQEDSVVPPGPNVKQGAMSHDEALKMVDRQVNRFIDSTVFGAGPRRARSAGDDDDI
jgi:hypothetical protein